MLLLRVVVLMVEVAQPPLPRCRYSSSSSSGGRSGGGCGLDGILSGEEGVEIGAGWCSAQRRLARGRWALTAGCREGAGTRAVGPYCWLQGGGWRR